MDEEIHGVLPHRRRVWAFFHWVLIFSFALNLFLVVQLERAKDIQEELIKDHLETIKKQNKMIEDLKQPRKKDDWP